MESINLHSNFLAVAGRELRADVLKHAASERRSVTDEELYTYLVMGRSAILAGIESMYEQTCHNNPNLTVVRPSIWVAQLGTATQTDRRPSRVFSEAGERNGGVITCQAELQDAFHGHWQAVHEAGFVPEVRRTTGKKDAGAWLLLRKPTLRQVETQWFAPYAMSDSVHRNAVDHFLRYDDDMTPALRFRSRREEAIERLYQEPEVYSNAQIAHMIGMAALKEAAGRPDDAFYEASDAIEYAYQNPYTDGGAVWAIVNSQHRGE